MKRLLIALLLALLTACGGSYDGEDNGGGDSPTVQDDGFSLEISPSELSFPGGGGSATLSAELTFGKDFAEDHSVRLTHGSLPTGVSVLFSGQPLNSGDPEGLEVTKSQAGQPLELTVTTSERTAGDNLFFQIIGQAYDERGRDRGQPRDDSNSIRIRLE